MVAFAGKDLTNALRGIKHEARSIGGELRAGGATAIFAVHGVSPIQRYAFQDQVAAALQGYLNSQEPQHSKLSWKSVVYWPECSKDGPADVEGVRPTALRVYRSDENDPLKPKGRIYDVYEGYWSPLSKGKTNIASAVRWLLNATFLGTSSTASIPCTPQKLAFDVSYVVTLLGVALLLCAGAAALGWFGWRNLAAVLAAGGGSGLSYSDVLDDPLRNIFRLPIVVYAEFIVDLILGYVVAQLFVVYNTRRKRLRNTAAVKNDVKQTGHFHKKVEGTQWFHRIVLAILWAAFVILGVLAWQIPIWFSHSGSEPTRWFVVYVLAIAIAVAILQAARSIADFAVENVLGDVQIYTTHDQNSAFYGIRQLIIASVGLALKGVLSVAERVTPADESFVEEPKPYYERIHILGHSLGSTVAMDVLILLRQLIQEQTLPDRQWQRIRSFTTFGTALEKTRFFFDVRQPTLNAAQDQWGNDVYGRYFTDKIAALALPTNAGGIYWSNYWYQHDIVANAIESYKSSVEVGDDFVYDTSTRRICHNVPIPHRRPPWAWVHSDYLADEHFWVKVGPILTS